MTEHDTVLERRPVEKKRGHGKQSIEPSARLIHRFADKVRGEKAVEFLFILKGIVQLSKGHAARIAPAIEHFARAVHTLAALGTLDCDRVDIGLMQLDVAVETAQLLELLLAADDVHVSALAYPERKRRAPVPLAGDAPVDDVVEEVSHASRAYRGGNPVDGSVVPEQLVPDGGHLDEPARASVVEQGRVAAPAEGIGVLEHEFLKQQAPVLEQAHYRLIAVLAELSVQLRVRALGESAAFVHALQEGQAVAASHPRVVLAECGRDVDYARAVGKGDVAVARDVVRLLLAVVTVEQRLVCGALESSALLDLYHLIILEMSADERLGKYVYLALALYHGIILVGIHTQRHVGRKRPRRGGPGKEVAALAHALKLGYARLLLDVLIALRHLVRGQRRAAAGAVRHYLVPLVYQALLVNALERPPHRLDIIVVVSDVGVVHVRPVTYALGHALPFAFILPYALFTLADEGLYAVLLYLLLAVDAQLLLNLELYGQSVSVPARLALDVIAFHGAIAGYDVLHYPREYVTYVRLAVGGRRSVVEGKRGLAFVPCHALFKNFILLPPLDYLLFSEAEIHIRRNFIVHLSPPCDVRAVCPPRRLPLL